MHAWTVDVINIWLEKESELERKSMKCHVNVDRKYYGGSYKKNLNL